MLVGTNMNNPKRCRSSSQIWTADELRLVEIVKKYPVLYSLPIKVNNKKQMWDIVAMEMGLPVDICRQRWANIKNGYLRNRKSRGGDFKSYSKYLDGQLDFLDNNIKFQKKRGATIKNNMTADLSIGENSNLLVDSKPENATDVETPKNFPVLMQKKPTQLQSNSSTTVLTQDIIGYILKSSSDKLVDKKDDDLFQSMASLVPESTLQVSPIPATCTATYTEESIEGVNIKTPQYFTSNIAVPQEDDNSNVNLRSIKQESMDEEINEDRIELEDPNIECKKERIEYLIVTDNQLNDTESDV